MQRFLFSKLTQKVIFILLILTSIFSCSKDSDLLAEYVNLDNKEVLSAGNFIMNDQYTISRDKSIVLDVLSNDTFANLDKVKIVETSEAKNGMVVINDDNTLTYTPSSSTSLNPIPEATTNEPLVTETETTAIETPKTDTSTTETPSSETTTTDTSPTDTSTTETSTTETSSTETSSTDTSTTDTSTTDTSTTEIPSTETTTTDTTPTSTTTEDEGETTDTFTYTTEEENENGTVTTNEGTVTITTIAENVYYVTVTGNAGNDGKSEENAWSLSHAISNAKAGDNIFIKAGNYGNFRWTQSTGGNSENPIKFIGYKTEIGDINTTTESSVAYVDSPNPSVDASEMPLLSGGINSGTAITATSNSTYVHFENIQISGYSIALQMTPDHLTLKNIVIEAPGVQNSDATYNGKGMNIYGDYVTIENCFVLNAGAEAITLSGANNCIVRNNKVYCDNLDNGTDYYILMLGDSQNNLVDGCYVYRKIGIKHPGHGLTIKNGPQNNIFQNSTLINGSIEVNGDNSKENLFKDIIISGGFDEATYKGDTAANIKIENGANNNEFQDINISGAFGAVAFIDFDDGNSPNDAVDAGNNNTFKRINVTNSGSAISFGEFQKLEGRAWNNTFTDCSFKNVRTLFRVNRPNSDNKLINSTVENVDNFWQTSNGYNYELNSNTVFENVLWINVGFTPPSN